MLTIDGSFGEGGGQILRTSLALSAITGQDVTIENIRAKRDKPGLRPQHLTSVIAISQICGAEISGVSAGSERITFKPHKVRPGQYEFDISTAGSVNLVLQAILWPLALTDKGSRIVIKGGTHVPHAPTFNYIDDVFLPAVARMGLFCNYHMEKAGYYPTGSGEVRLEIRPVESLQPINLPHRTEPIHIKLTSAVSNLPESISQRQMDTGLEYIRGMGIQPDQDMKQYPSPGKGTLFFIGLSSGNIKSGFQSLGARGKPAEKVAKDACVEFENYWKSGMAIDPHLADQLIIPMALAKGTSMFTTSEITQHLLTNISIVQRFLPVQFHVSRGIGEPGTVEKVEG